MRQAGGQAFAPTAAPSQLRLILPRQALLAGLPLTTHELGEWENLGPLNTGSTVRRRCCDTVGGVSPSQGFCVVTGSPLTHPSSSLSLSRSQLLCNRTEMFHHPSGCHWILVTCGWHVYSPSSTRKDSLLFTTVASANYVLTCRTARAARFN